MRVLHQCDLEMPFEEEALLRLTVADIKKMSSFDKVAPETDSGQKFNFGVGNGCRVKIGEPSNGYWDFIKLSDDMILTVTDAFYKRAEKIIVQGEDLLKLRFLIQGSMRWLEDDVLLGDEELVHAGPCTVVSYHPEGADIQYTPEANEQFTMMTLHCQRSLVQRFFNSKGFDQLTGRSNCSGSDQFVDAELPLTPKIRLCVNEILWSPFTGETRWFYVKAKCMELLCIVSSLHEELNDPSQKLVAKIVLSKKDVARLERVRNLIDGDLTQWYSSAELCRHVGLNVKKLKYGFKKVFGKTPYKYSVDIRMETAYRTIKEQNLSISEVAYMLGYNYPANFTTAFKKHFGYTPQHLRGQMNIIS